MIPDDRYEWDHDLEEERRRRDAEIELARQAERLRALEEIQR
jgi:hypothetical protein